MFFQPVIEPEKHKDEVFLPDRPIDLIRNGKFHMVPLIIGVTSREGKLILPGRRFFYFTRCSGPSCHFMNSVKCSFTNSSI